MIYARTRTAASNPANPGPPTTTKLEPKRRRHAQLVADDPTRGGDP